VPVFRHFPLLLAPDGKRLSKRDASAGLADLSHRFSPEEIWGKLAFLAGFHPSAAPAAIRELLDEFSWDRVPVREILLPSGLFD